MLAFFISLTMYSISQLKQYLDIVIPMLTNSGLTVSDARPYIGQFNVINGVVQSDYDIFETFQYDHFSGFLPRKDTKSTIKIDLLNTDLLFFGFLNCTIPFLSTAASQSYRKYISYELRNWFEWLYRGNQPHVLNNYSTRMYGRSGGVDNGNPILFSSINLPGSVIETVPEKEICYTDETTTIETRYFWRLQITNNLFDYEGDAPYTMRLYLRNPSDPTNTAYDLIESFNDNTYNSLPDFFAAFILLLESYYGVSFSNLTSTPNQQYFYTDTDIGSLFGIGQTNGSPFGQLSIVSVDGKSQPNHCNIFFSYDEEGIEVTQASEVCETLPAEYAFQIDADFISHFVGYTIKIQ